MGDNPVNKVFQSEKAILYEGDCRELKRKNKVDLIVVDPPYGESWKSGWGRHSPIVGDSGDLDVVDLVSTVAASNLRDNRHVYIFGRGRWDIKDLLTESGEIIWDKGIVGLGDLSSHWSTSHEVITFATHCKSQSGIKKGRGKLAARLRRGSVIKANRKSGRAANRHPTEKPVHLLRQLIESSSNLGEVVLDPCAGSGSTLVAAIIEGRKAVGVEIDPKWIPVCIERIEKAERLSSEMKGL